MQIQKRKGLQSSARQPIIYAAALWIRVPEGKFLSFADGVPKLLPVSESLSSIAQSLAPLQIGATDAKTETLAGNGAEMVIKKVRCINGNEAPFTVGKIYEVVYEGTSSYSLAEDDNGSKPSAGWFKSRFEDVKEDEKIGHVITYDGQPVAEVSVVSFEAVICKKEYYGISCKCGQMST